MGSPVIFQFQNIQLLDYNTYDLLKSVKVAGSASFSLTGELVEQMSGPSLFSIETELNRFTTEASIVFRNYDSDLLEVLAGAETSKNTPTGGQIVQMLNQRGGEIFSDSFISVTAITSDSINAGLYRLLVVDSTTGEVEIKRISGPNFSPWTGNYTFGAASTVEDTGQGFSLGTGTNYNLTNAGLSAGGVATFRVLPKGAEHFQSIVGRDGARVPKLKVVALSRSTSDNRWYETYFPNCIFPGVNWNFAEEFSENEVAGKIVYDSREDCIAKADFFGEVD